MTNGMYSVQEGIQYTVPLSGQHFQQLLLSLAHLYAGDSLDLGLAEAYWCAADSGINSFIHSSFHLFIHSFIYSFIHSLLFLTLGGGLDTKHCPAKQIALYKFVRLAGDLLMPSLFVPYITMLAGLADSPG